mgnify:CR=1 FL=1
MKSHRPTAVQVQFIEVADEFSQLPVNVLETKVFVDNDSAHQALEAYAYEQDHLSARPNQWRHKHFPEFVAYATWYHDD